MIQMTRQFATAASQQSMRIKSIRKAWFSRSSLQWDGRISMVQGASRGIGLEFVKQLLERNGGNVIATCRNPLESTGLNELKAKFSDRLDILKLDITDENSIQASSNSIKEKFGHLNLLINASGVLSIPDVLHPETTLRKVEKSSLMLAYEVNAIGPILVTKIGGDTDIEGGFAVVANLSARVGSIGDNGLGGWHSYRASKTALNQLTKNLAVEFGRRKDQIVCLLLHPGTVDTDLSKPFQKNVPNGKLFTKEFSVQKLLNVIDSAKISDNGKFFAWDGQLIQW
ncbi:Short-chain dehydrogenase/reductase family protein [Zostera marina]|uniref:Short-chain dehydrogenase/reductase family protein n=1 Tax=Zostera marina TaxID=29655 RepID=A0A0K9NJ71_ZOSMR|nr:Short-chain dehydrogenase/reductase family protein [Zostera marina]